MIPLKDSRWLYMRILLLILSLFSARFTEIPTHPDFLHPASWHFLLMLVGFGIFGIQFSLGMQVLSNSSYERYLAPSWFLPPFIYKQPLVSFDTASYCVIGNSIGGAIIGLSKTPADWSWEIPLFAGIGVWIGVRVYVFINRDKVDS